MDPTRTATWETRVRREAEVVKYHNGNTPRSQGEKRVRFPSGTPCKKAVLFEEYGVVVYWALPLGYVGHRLDRVRRA
jgi:hypothetical protein